MESNSFGKKFKITTFGESHGKYIGVIIDGCPPNIEISEKEINKELEKRRPGRHPFASKRKETDKAKIISGIYKGKSTGAPLTILIKNIDIDSSYYEKTKDIFRPSHANYTYHKKYGHFDPLGGGRASARETAARVAAGAIARKILKEKNIEVLAFIDTIGQISTNIENEYDFNQLKKNTDRSTISCPETHTEEKMIKLLTTIEKEKDSIGGIIRLITTPLPIGLGEPIYEKFSANLAKAMLSIPGCVGFEIGKGFNTANMKGSTYNDLFTIQNDIVKIKTNNQGGILGGISNGNPLDIKVAFKPTPTIGINQNSVNIRNEKAVLPPPNNKRYDICIAIRAVKVVEAMTMLTIIDAL